MSMLSDLQRRLELLEKRVAQLEAASGLSAPVAQPVETEAVQPSEEDDQAHSAPMGMLARELPASAVPTAAVAPPADQPPVASPSPSRPPVVPPPLPPQLPKSTPVIAYQPPIERPAPVREGGLEQTIGLKWAGWVGALVLLIGAALAVRYSYEMWLSKASAEVRLALMAAGGLALIGAGEWVYRRVHVRSAVGLFGAGVATLFLVAYAGYGYLDVYSRQVAFILMAIVTLIGAGVAMRGRLASIAVLSLIGGHFVPVVLSSGKGRIGVLLGYVLMLQLVAVLLAAWGASKRWWTLRWLALVMTALWMAIVLQGRDYSLDGLPLAFTLIYAAIFQAELLYSTLRSPREQEVTPDGAGSSAAVFSIAVTAGMVTATLVALHDAAPMVRGAWILGQAAVLAAVGFAFGRAGILAAVLRMQAAALLIVAVPVALSGAAVTLAWAMLALAYAAMGARWDLRISRMAAIVTWSLAMLYVPWRVSNDTGDDQPLRELLVSRIPLYVALLWVGALVGHGVAALIGVTRRESERQELQRAGVALSGLATAAWIVAAIAGLPTLGATLSLVIYAWLLAGGDFALNRLKLAHQAMAVLIVATLKWALVDLLAQGLGQGWSNAQLNYLPLLNPLMGMGVLLAASLAGVWRLRRASLQMTDAQPRHMGQAVVTGLWLIVAIALTAEIDRVIEAARGSWISPWNPGHIKQLCWTMLWSVSLLGLGATLWRMTDQPARRHRQMGALSVFAALLVGKYIIFDTLAWRLFRWTAPGAFIANLEALTALVLLGVLAAAAWALRTNARLLGRQSVGGPVVILAAVALVLYAGTLEIDRAFAQFGGRALIGKQVAWSIWWSIVAIGSVAMGFALRTRTLRYAGLGLFALTVVKVFIVDLQNVGTGWRTLSFIGLGLLLMGTSVLYGKFSPRILAARRESDQPPAA